ncbi:MAG TPA: AAA family ATPase [Geodermatophilus sp.]|nr:AAA family ATPase [Geodermatophilus sp.]
MTIACGLSERDGDALAASLGGPVTVLADLTAVLRSLRGARAEALVVLGPEVPHHQVLRFAARARAERSDALIVLLRPSANRLERQSAREAGVDAILPAADVPAAGRSCREFLAARSGRSRGRLVTVFAAKGGCGKTTIAANLAVALAEDPARRVCLVDLDLRFGDLAVTLGLEPQRTITSGAPADGDRVAAMVTPLRPRLDCVLAPVRPGEAERLEVDGVEDVLDALTDRYDVVVVDTPATFSRPVVTALDLSEHHVLVTTPERPALHSLRKTLDTMDLLGHRRDSRSVLFNRSDSGVGITADDVERTLHAPIAAHIPSSRDVATSINRCLPLMAASPDHPVSTAIRHFALARLTSPAAAPPSLAGGAMT